MEFVVGLPRKQKQYDCIWLVVNTLTKYAHFVLVKSTFLAEDNARIFIDENVYRHDISLSIISDKGT